MNFCRIWRAFSPVFDTLEHLELNSSADGPRFGIYLRQVILGKKSSQIGFIFYTAVVPSKHLPLSCPMPQDLHPSAVLDDAALAESSTDAPTVVRSPEPQSFSANLYAERLMDDLFQEVEQLLDLEAPVAPAATPVNSPAPASDPQPFPATEVRERVERAMPLVPRLEAVALQEAHLGAGDHLAPVAPDPLTTPSVSAVSSSTAQSGWQRLAVVVGGVSVVVVLGLWLLYQDGKHRQQAAFVTPLGVTATVSSADQKFADYVQKSLQQIDQSGQPGAVGSTVAGNSGTAPGMPTVVIPKTPGSSPLAANSSDPKERVYVPVYQLPTNLYPAGSPIAPLPNLPAASKSTAPAGRSKVTAAAGVQRQLVGVLEQGENSVALFEINGVTQRYELGESIGSSGWTLVEVSKNQAIIRRNGDVRSLFVGHSF